MTPLYLQFTDQAQSNSVLYTITTDSSNTVIQRPNYQNIDVIGTIYQPTPNPLPDSYTSVPYDGYHVNVLVLDTENQEPLLPYSIDPQPFPMRVWAI
jgi:hypothetical protein